jgi:hypothetical protein
MLWNIVFLSFFLQNLEYSLSTLIKGTFQPYFLSCKFSQVVDSPYDVQANMNVEGGIIWGISVHSIHNGEIFIFSSVYI